MGWAALSSAPTLEATYELARMTIERGIPGDFVECGVFAGVQCAAMAKALMDYGVTDRKVHLFDSFAGIPQAGPKDTEFLAAGHAAGLSTCSLGQVQEYMQAWGIDPALLIFHVGLFSDTVPAAEIGPIALLRLDGDLYESTKVCMEHLYPKLSKGGWCIADDFKLAGCRAAIEETIGVPGPLYWRKDG